MSGPDGQSLTPAEETRLRDPLPGGPLAHRRTAAVASAVTERESPTPQTSRAREVGNAPGRAAHQGRSSAAFQRPLSTHSGRWGQAGDQTFKRLADDEALAAAGPFAGWPFVPSRRISDANN